MATLVFENNNHNVFSEDTVDPIVSMINRYDNDLRLFESLLTLDFVEAYNESGNAVLTEAEEKKLQENGAKKVLNTIIEFIKSIPERIMKLITMFLDKIKKFYREHIKTLFGGKKPKEYLKDKRKAASSKASTDSTSTELTTTKEPSISTTSSNNKNSNEISQKALPDNQSDVKLLGLINKYEEDFSLIDIDKGLGLAEEDLWDIFDYFKYSSGAIKRMKNDFSKMNEEKEKFNKRLKEGYLGYHGYFVNTNKSAEYEYEGAKFDIVLGYLEDGAYNKVEKTLKKSLNELKSTIKTEEKEILSIQTSEGPVVYSFIKEILSKVYSATVNEYKQIMSNFTKALSCATSVFNKFTRSGAVDESTYLYDLALNEYMEEALALDF